MRLRRLPLHLAIALLTFVVGVVSAASYRYLTTFDSGPIVESSAISFIEVSQPADLEIHAQMHACGPRVNAHGYFASDGARLSMVCQQMASARRAARELEKRLANATEIIERHEELTEHNAVVKTRVVVANSNGVTSYSISGKSFCETTAPSLKHLRLVEP